LRRVRLKSLLAVSDPPFHPVSRFGIYGVISICGQSVGDSRSQRTGAIALPFCQYGFRV